MSLIEYDGKGEIKEFLTLLNLVFGSLNLRQWKRSSKKI